ncbi:hypothetical protein IQ252_24530 [Tychonema sp. LEGE 07203]|nr:hypothetical protein [Tychonema sp. LEGE 07203]
MKEKWYNLNLDRVRSIAIAKMVRSRVLVSAPCGQPNSARAIESDCG